MPLAGAWRVGHNEFGTMAFITCPLETLMNSLSTAIMPLAIGIAAAFLPAFASAAGPALEGQPAPEIDLPATSPAKAVPGKSAADHLKLSELRGKCVVLYFFPKALTSG
jgi:hypothetical protein